MIELDRIDRSILAMLQAEGRISNSELAKRVGVSAPACWKRVKRLEEQAVAGYHARLDRVRLGFDLFAFVCVTLDDHTEPVMMAFEETVAALPRVIACHNVSGKYDYVVQVVSRDMDEFHEEVMRRFRSIAHIKEIYTHFSLNEIKHGTSLPV